MSGLQGVEALRRRVKAIKTVASDSSSTSLTRKWQDATVRAARPHIPVRTGETRRSVRPGKSRSGRPAVVAKYTVNFIDAGSKAHIEPRQPGLTPTGRVSRRKVGSGKILKFQAGGKTLFRKKVNKPAIPAHPFKKAAAQQGLRDVNFATHVVGLWNRAA